MARSLLRALSVKEEGKDEFRSPRMAMVDEQLRERGIADDRVLGAMSKVPRHLFVPQALRRVAYEDGAFPIGHGQTISQPYMVARMVEALELTGEERVLDIGTGSGYQAAVLSELAREVWSVEIVPELADEARERLARLGYSNVHVVTANGSVGLPNHAPFDAIVVAAAAPELPQSLVDQLGPGGRLVIPIGDIGIQMLRRIRKIGVRTPSEALLDCVFVPLVGEEGWKSHRANVRI
jgi:protein-L-isoaspartate(D-aspartate) O-methyltransferase